MFAQIVTLIVSHFFNRMSPQGQEGVLTSLSLAALRRAFAMVCLGLLAITFFTGGFITVLVDLILSSQGQGSLYLSPVSIVGFSLIGLAVIGVLVATRQTMWQAPAAQISVNQTPSPLNEALAKLVMDFVEERKASRIHPEADFNEPARDRSSTSEPPPVYM